MLQVILGDSPCRNRDHLALGVARSFVLQFVLVRVIQILNYQLAVPNSLGAMFDVRDLKI